ncbi:MAG: UDP-3-O-(3-hydroxymyristoyl)glucosamine N-acyltransferase [candidate division KSB1 bacterium]|nr:UDP-3-O-(3-hydroxymyristoyl)glucosamine N-acyltransferase [candidate division KSB1 bacterium]
MRECAGMELTTAELAVRLQAELEGEGEVLIRGVAPIETAEEGQLSFIANPKYNKYARTTRASALIVSRDFQGESRVPLLRVANPYLAFQQAVRLFYPEATKLEPGIHATAIVHESAELGHDVAIAPYVVIEKGARIGHRTQIYPGCYIGEDVQIGDDCVLYPHVVVRERVRIGNRVIVHAGTVIGADGFGFAREGDRYHKIPQAGTVVIGDDVEIGANCCIDRATLGETRIERGVKMDNLIQVGHNVVIGENTVIAAQAGFAGSTIVGRNVMVGGQAGFAGHMTIGDGAQISAQSGVTKDIPPGCRVFGYPARPAEEAWRQEAALRRLPELLKRVRELERAVEELQSQRKEEAKRSNDSA